MKWVYSIRPKTKAAFILAFIFFLVLGKNIIDNNNVSKLGTSFSSVYEDRLLTESYIYKISGHLYQKKILLDKTHTNFKDTKKIVGLHNTAINSLIDEYEKTEFTKDEYFLFSAFKKNMSEIMLREDQYIFLINAGASEKASQAKNLLDIQFNFASAQLNRLSGIQLSEAKILNDNSKKIISSSALLTHFELALLIGIGIVIQFLVQASNNIFPTKSQHHSLN